MQLQDGWLIASIIFISISIFLYWRKMLSGLTELEKIGIVVGIIIAAIPVLDFVFGDGFSFPEWARISFGIAAVGIPLGIIIVPRIMKNVKTIDTSKIETATGVTKVLGTPDSIHNGIQIYKSRPRIPLDVLLSEATKRVDMLAVTFHEITTGNIKLIEETIYRNIRITFIILRANSEYAKNREDDLHEGEEIPHHIERSLKVLCNLKRKVGSNYSDNLIIKTYNASIDNSIIIIDNNLIKVESHVKRSDPNSRPNRLAYRADNGAFFEQYSNEFNGIKTEIYNC